MYVLMNEIFKHKKASNLILIHTVYMSYYMDKLYVRQNIFITGTPSCLFDNVSWYLENLMRNI